MASVPDGGASVPMPGSAATPRRPPANRGVLPLFAAVVVLAVLSTVGMRLTATVPAGAVGKSVGAFAGDHLVRGATAQSAIPSDRAVSAGGKVAHARDGATTPPHAPAVAVVEEAHTASPAEPAAAGTAVNRQPASPAAEAPPHAAAALTVDSMGPLCDDGIRGDATAERAAAFLRAALPPVAPDTDSEGASAPETLLRRRRVLHEAMAALTAKDLSPAQALGEAGLAPQVRCFADRDPATAPTVVPFCVAERVRLVAGSSGTAAATVLVDGAEEGSRTAQVLASAGVRLAASGDSEAPDAGGDSMTPAGDPLAPAPVVFVSAAGGTMATAAWVAAVQLQLAWFGMDHAVAWLNHGARGSIDQESHAHQWRHHMRAAFAVAAGIDTVGDIGEVAAASAGSHLTLVFPAPAATVAAVGGGGDSEAASRAAQAAQTAATDAALAIVSHAYSSARAVACGPSDDSAATDAAAPPPAASWLGGACGAAELSRWWASHAGPAGVGAPPKLEHTPLGCTLADKASRPTIALAAPSDVSRAAVAAAGKASDLRVARVGPSNAEVSAAAECVASFAAVGGGGDSGVSVTQASIDGGSALKPEATSQWAALAAELSGYDVVVAAHDYAPADVLKSMTAPCGVAAPVLAGTAATGGGTGQSGGSCAAVHAALEGRVACLAALSRVAEWAGSAASVAGAVAHHESSPDTVAHAGLGAADPCWYERRAGVPWRVFDSPATAAAAVVPGDVVYKGDTRTRAWLGHTPCGSAVVLKGSQLPWPEPGVWDGPSNEVEFLRLLENSGRMLSDLCWTCFPRALAPFDGCDYKNGFPTAEDAAKGRGGGDGYCGVFEAVAGEQAAVWLERHLREGDTAGATGLVEQLLNILDLFRQLGVQHRDLHRNNMLVRKPLVTPPTADADAGARANGDAKPAPAARQDEALSKILSAVTASVASGRGSHDPWRGGQPENELVVIDFSWARAPQRHETGKLESFLLQNIGGHAQPPDQRAANGGPDDVYTAVKELLYRAHAKGVLTPQMAAVLAAVDKPNKSDRQRDVGALRALLRGPSATT